MTTYKSNNREKREIRRKERQRKRTAESTKNASVKQHKDFGYTQKQNLQWLRDQYDLLPDHGAISLESAGELERYFNVKDEKKLRKEGLGEEARAILARLEGERQMMREARGVSGRVKNWWMEPMLIGVVENDGEGEGQGLAMEGGKDKEEKGGVALDGEEHIWGACSPVMMSPAGSGMDDEEEL